MTHEQSLPNFELRDEIREYWGRRAETFDSQPGHEIFSEEERLAWLRLFEKHLECGNQRKVLDLASGTGVISHLLDDLGFDVTGMDWAEPMLAKARAKAKARARAIRFLLGDAERTLEPSDHYDAVTCRHLVWTLVDPATAFSEWHRILKPGGRLLIVDGDFVNMGPISKILSLFAGYRGSDRSKAPSAKDPMAADMAAVHRSILQRVYFSNGARADSVASLLQAAGFTDIAIDSDLKSINRAQRRHLPFFKGLERATQHRYAICAVK
ncbi:class I SAM-dependent methyltransferase [Roseibium aggregatum]|uniref:Class I SAM-dependent methyltransferase n=1 Tax=Roseibium aggregatum TaxID=187304 RepID=A0A939ECI4_9HYPH|nr:class I SAM-dependent methyltransferase [Roseibium aggregatum]MBN9670057.1 class I SAM-dependent methyltransferase [Roseibium aggregatum]